MATQRKRAPGAGRKPKGEFTGKSATITTRIRPDTRDALERAARANGRSLSQEVEFRLRAGLLLTDAQQRNQALSQAIARMVEGIEKGTGRSWLEDPFTGLALRHAIQAFAFHCAPFSTDDLAEVPPMINEAAAKMLSTFAEQFRTPEGFGLTNAHLIITEIESAARPTGVPHSEWDMPIFFSAPETVLSEIGRHLGLPAKKGREK
jgi:TraY domain